MAISTRCSASRATASDDEIKKAYRKLAMQYHPDRNGGSKDAEESFKEITEAYDVLRDPQKRAVYDRYGEAGLRGRGHGAACTTWTSPKRSASSCATSAGSAASRTCSAAARAAASGPRAPTSRSPCRSRSAEVATGVEKKIVRQAARSVRAAAAGSGAEPGTKPQACPTCAGHGRGAARAALVLRAIRERGALSHLRRAGQDDRDPVQEVQRRGAQPRGAHDHGADPGRRRDGTVPHDARPGKRRAARRPARRHPRGVRGARTIRASSATARISTPRCS